MLTLRYVIALHSTKIARLTMNTVGIVVVAIMNVG